MVTIFYAGILGLFYVVLSALVVRGRYGYKVSLGDGGNPDMIRRIRAHGNFAEYVPFALLLLFMADYVQYSPILIHALGISLVLGRLFHAIALYRDTFRLRVTGMILTFLVIAVSSILLIWHFLALQMFPLSS